MDDVEKKTPKGRAASRYMAGTTDREPYLVRARRCARLTVTSLFPEQDQTGSSDETLPWQSAGAFMVNSFAAKQAMAMFPPGLSFIRLKPDRKTLASLQELDEAERGKIKALIEQGLAGVERELVEAMEEDGDRAKLFDAVRHLVVGGNHGLKVDPKTAILQSIPLSSYVNWRDKSGNLLEFVIEDALSWETLPKDVQEMCEEAGYEEDEKKSTQDSIMLYTHGRLEDGKWEVYQECWGQRVPGTDWTWTPDAMPYLFLREIAVNGEHYGRSYCEDYEADLQTMDAFWQILTEGAAASALLKWLVRPGGSTNKEQFTKLPNGGVMTGDVNDVAAVRADKGGDLVVAGQKASEAEQRLAKVFLLYSSIQRKGERVTAEEIATLRQDLENTQGGVFANQLTTFQAPYARLKLRVAQQQKRVTPIREGSVKMTVLTGDLGLGRNAQATDLDQFLGTFQALFPQAAQQYVSPSIYAARSGANKGIDTDGLIRSEEEVQRAEQAQRQLEMAAKLGPNVIDQGGQMLQNRQQAQLDTQAPPQPEAVQ